MEANQAKKIVKEWLERHGMSELKLTAKTVSFEDLARTSCVFITVKGWKPNPLWSELESLARSNSFRVQA